MCAVLKWQELKTGLTSQIQKDSVSLIKSGIGQCTPSCLQTLHSVIGEFCICTGQVSRSSQVGCLCGTCIGHGSWQPMRRFRSLGRFSSEGICSPSGFVSLSSVIGCGESIASSVASGPLSVSWPMTDSATKSRHIT